MGDEDALRFLSRLVNYEHQSPAARHLALDAIRALLSALGNPHDRLFIIHVAGTKGKGSVASMLERVLRQAGYRTGLYTSPHLIDPRERIQIAGQRISEEAWLAAFNEVHDAAERPGQQKGRSVHARAPHPQRGQDPGRRAHRRV